GAGDWITVSHRRSGRSLWAALAAWALCSGVALFALGSLRAFWALQASGAGVALWPFWTSATFRPSFTFWPVRPFRARVSFLHGDAGDVILNAIQFDGS